MAVAHDHSAAERPVDVSPGGQTHQRRPVGDTSRAVHDLLDVHALSLPKTGGRGLSSSTGRRTTYPMAFLMAVRRPTGELVRRNTTVSRSGGGRPTIAPLSSVFEHVLEPGPIARMPGPSGDRACRDHLDDWSRRARPPGAGGSEFIHRFAGRRTRWGSSS